ncbi:MAG: hypothetical protein A2204_03725 [Elusimicrobia bacterium RIFOXYA1_FULL_47_7]|nr:MAG: hypothetical protein A2204_03725 [Elusimicrobia bacterium RIFOXYA1_FULL_47_7]
MAFCNGSQTTASGMTTLKKSIVASEGTRQHAKGSVAGDSPPKVQWWGNLAVKWFCSGAACCAFRKVRHSGNVLSRGEKSPVFGRVKNASHSPGRPADFIQSIGPPLRNPEKPLDTSFRWHDDTKELPRLTTGSYDFP